MTNIYHPNGQVAWTGSMAYHINGNQAWTTQGFAYHDNQQIAWTGSDAYYANGFPAWHNNHSFDSKGNFLETNSRAWKVDLGSGFHIMVSSTGAELFFKGKKLASAK
ncbi:MAG: hypothetical protein IAF02_02355 [Anaerolineae bacterium]|nr:hypothetical protein [Anaerolineae bacterium]